MPSFNAKIRTVAVNFPHTEEGDFLFAALKVQKESEDRSYSKIIYRLLEDYFMGDGVNPEFVQKVEAELAGMRANTVVPPRVPLKPSVPEREAVTHDVTNY